MKRSVVALSLLASTVTCRTPTEIRVDLRGRGFQCAGSPGPIFSDASVYARSSNSGAMASDGLARSTACEPSSDDPSVLALGTVTVLPNETGRATIYAAAALENEKSETCLASALEGGANLPANCIVASRDLAFLDHVSLSLRIDLDTRCAGVRCAADETCLEGICVDNTVTCEGADCGAVGEGAGPSTGGGGATGGAGGQGGEGGAGAGSPLCSTPEGFEDPAWVYLPLCSGGRPQDLWGYQPAGDQPHLIVAASETLYEFKIASDATGFSVTGGLSMSTPPGTYLAVGGPYGSDDPTLIYTLSKDGLRRVLFEFVSSGIGAPCTPLESARIGLGEATDETGSFLAGVRGQNCSGYVVPGSSSGPPNTVGRPAVAAVSLGDGGSSWALWAGTSSAPAFLHDGTYVSWIAGDTWAPQEDPALVGFRGGPGGSVSAATYYASVIGGGFAQVSADGSNTSIGLFPITGTSPVVADAWPVTQPTGTRHIFAVGAVTSGEIAQPRLVDIEVSVSGGVASELRLPMGIPIKSSDWVGIYATNDEDPFIVVATTLGVFVTRRSLMGP